MFSRLRWLQLRSVAGDLLGGDTWLIIFTSTKVFTGTVPFSNDPPHTIIPAIIGGWRPPRPANPTFTDSLWALTQQCWDQDAHLRPQVSEVLRILHDLSVFILDRAPSA